MAGRFEGLSDLEWKLFEDLLPQPPKKEDVVGILPRKIVQPLTTLQVDS